MARVTATVRGTYATLPLGYPWVIGLWYVAIAFLASAQFHSRYAIIVFVVVLAAGFGAMIVLSRAEPKAFAADDTGIYLGVPSTSAKRDQRRLLQIPWRGVREIRVRAAPHGAIVEIFVTEGLAQRPPKIRGAAAIALTALVPYTYLWLRPPLLCQLADPPRYRVPLYHADITALTEALRPVAPATVPISAQ